MGKSRRHSTRSARQRATSRPPRATAEGSEQRERSPQSEPRQGTTRAKSTVRSSHSDFWEFWNLADQAHEIRRNIRIGATTVVPMVAGLLVFSLLVLAISQGPTLIAGGGSDGSSGSYDAASPAGTDAHPGSHREVEVAATTNSTGSDSGTEGVPGDDPGVAPDDARARPAETSPAHPDGSASHPPDEGASSGGGADDASSYGQGSHAAASNGGGADEAASNYGQGSQDAVPGGAPAPGGQTEAPGDGGATAVPAHTNPGAHALGGAAREPVPQVPNIPDGHGEACATHGGPHAVGSPCPDEAAAEPVPPTAPGGVPATVAMWCVLEPVGTTGIGCGPGTTQVLELVEVATVDPLTIAVWCLPQVTDVGVTECGASDPRLLEIVSPGVVVPATSPAAESTTVAAEATAQRAAAAQEGALVQSGTSPDTTAATAAAGPVPEGDPASWSSPDEGDPPMHGHTHDQSYDHSAEHGGCDRTWEPHDHGGDA